jgi:hypothetical protein
MMLRKRRSNRKWDVICVTTKYYPLYIVAHHGGTELLSSIINMEGLAGVIS